MRGLSHGITVLYSWLSYFPDAPSRRKIVVFLGFLIAFCAGSIIVRAGDDPGIRQAILDYNRAMRAATFERVGSVKKNLPGFSERPDQSALKVPAIREPEKAGISGFVPPERKLSYSIPFYPISRAERSIPANISVAAVNTNYCVRLCDGYLFPIGAEGSGQPEAQEMACRLACPQAQTALYSMPAGARDIGEARREGQPYTALPNAFRYRKAYDRTCRCNSMGSTQTTAAIIRDFTLRRGDVVMTKLGARYFEGSQQFPYRPYAFSDAVARLETAKERQQVRAMEVASLRGILSPEAHASLRQRIQVAMREADRAAVQTAPVRPVKVARGFEELRAERSIGPLATRAVARKTGWVALN